ncbi:unnamed protein product [Symbiodinium sp. CCMP2456]|nr:unnamed protein product [Symbiodinium sp. CCMP2456]
MATASREAAARPNGPGIISDFPRKNLKCRQPGPSAPQASRLSQGYKANGLLACSRELSTSDFGTSCGSSFLLVVLTTATGVCLFMLRRGVGMQLFEAAMKEQLDPAHESFAAVSSGLSGAREEQAWQQE